jgi:hypothetical protein
LEILNLPFRQPFRGFSGHIPLLLYGHMDGLVMQRLVKAMALQNALQEIAGSGTCFTGNRHLQ